MSDRISQNGHKSEEEMARERAYREYLKLREKQSHEGNNIKDDTLYGAYVSRSIPKEPEYMDRNHQGGAREPRRSDVRYGDNRQNNTNERYRGNDGREVNPPRAKRNAPIAQSGSVNKADKPTKAEKKAIKKAGKKKGRKLRIAVIILAILVIGIGGLIGVGFAVVKSTLDNVSKVELDPALIGIDPAVDEQLTGYRNIALLGIDARNMSDDSNCRSDSMIVVSINEETDEIKMFSVYRDTMLDLGPGTPGLDKVTHAYYYGGPTKSLYALNHNMDLNIKEVVVVNWKAVADTVDALGGLEIDIKESEINEMNKYIIDTQRNIGGSKELITEPGKQTLNGVQAVTYARIRKDAATGDYRRNERMKIVVKAAFQKAKKMDYKTLKKISKEILPEIKTNMSSADMMGLMLDLGSFKMTSSTTGWPYKVGSWSGDAWYGPPKDLAWNVSELHKDFFDQEGYVPTQAVQDIGVRIQQKTGIY